MRSTRSLAVLSLVGVLALAACGSDSDEADSTTAPGGSTAPVTGSITVGSADFPESQLLSYIYGQALEASGIPVGYKDPIGSRELYYKAITDDEIQLVPEYTNSLLSYVVHLGDPAAAIDAKNVDEQVTALKTALPATLTVGTPSSAEDKDVIVCNADTIEQYSLATLSDLAEHSADITLGAPPEFETRSPFGLVGFKDILGAESFKKFVPLAIGDMAASLKSGAIDCGNMFSTMSVITTEGLVALEDDKTLVPNEAVLPLITAASATPDVLAVLDKVSAGLTTQKLKALMVKVEVDKTAVDIVAEEYLKSLDSGS